REAGRTRPQGLRGRRRPGRAPPRYLADMSPGQAHPADEVSIEVGAPPERLWALVTDVTQMGRWSPECWKCTWLDGATGPAVGARFQGHNRRGVIRWSTVSTVVIADAPDHFAFEVDNS